MKIYCLIPSMRLGGAERQMAGLACALRDAGHDVAVVTYRGGDFYDKILEHSGVRRIRIGAGTARGTSSAAIVSALSEMLREDGVEVLISFLAGTNIKACLAAALLRCRMRGWRCRSVESQTLPRIVVSERNFNLKMMPHDWLRLRLYRRYAAAVVCNSHAQSEFVASHMPCAKPRLHTIPNFVNPAEFFPPGDVPSIVQPVGVSAQDGIGSRKGRGPTVWGGPPVPTPPQAAASPTGVEVRFVVTARLTPRKNALGLIEAARVLRERRPDAGFRIDWYGSEGRGRYERRCRHLIEKYHLQDIFTLHEAEHNMLSVYRSAHWFCLPSRYEGTSNSLSEALSCGVPAVCSRVSDNPRYVLEGESGFLFDSSSPEDIARAMSSAIDATPHREAFSAAAVRIATSSFAPERFAAGWLAVLEHCRRLI